MIPSSAARPDLPDLDARYAQRLIDTLVAEAEAIGRERPALRADIGGIVEGARSLADSRSGALSWDGAGARYQALCERLCAVLTAAGSIACEYGSMEEFWQDAERQAHGDSPNTFWDIYEHGARRRLEKRLAALYRVEDALLLNSGMSALAVAADAAGLRSGDGVWVNPAAYFETSDLLQRTQGQRGIAIAAFAPDSASAPPRLAIFESAQATPAIGQKHDAVLERLLATDCRIVIDNSLLGPGAAWPPYLTAHARVLFADSTAKYICRQVSGGLLYGSAKAVASAREIARGSGQQLQAAAFNHIRWGHIDAAALRLELHRRNARVLALALEASAAFLETGEAPQLNFACLGEAGSCILFLRLRGKDQTLALRHRRLLQRWRETAGADAPAIRAGYGWDRTTARCYEGQALKQSGVRDYLRISAGIESIASMARLAQTLALAIRETGGETGGETGDE
jgi:cystathionine beta-lyase/cystathionine gamma-synthase